MVRCHLDGHIGAAGGMGFTTLQSYFPFLLVHTLFLFTPLESPQGQASCPPYSPWYLSYPQYGILRLAWCIVVAQLILLE